MIQNIIITKKKYILINILFIFALLLTYLIVNQQITQDNITGPCAFKKYVHLYCPGCGGTRAVYELFHFHFFKSFIDNPVVIYIFFVYVYYDVRFFLCINKKNESVQYSMNFIWLFILLGILLFNFIFRNILLIFFRIDILGDFFSFLSFQNCGQLYK